MVGCIFAYELLALVLWGATLGKLLLRLRVLGFPGGSRVSPGSAAGRAAMFYLVWAVPCGIGSVLMLVSANNDPSGWRRAWHDRAAGTSVVKTA